MKPNPDSFAFDAFLSHNKADKQRVRQLAERLRSNGVKVWFDDWAIGPGDNIVLEVERGLESSRALILCLSSAALGSDWVGLERSAAIFRNPSNSFRRFLPLLLSDCSLPDMLRCYKYIDYRSESDDAFQELVGACLGLKTTQCAFSPVSDENLAKVRTLLTTRRNEWKRIRRDFENQAAKYSDLKLKVFFVDKDGPSSQEKFEGPNHAINLWQYYGAGIAARERLRSFRATNFGLAGAEVTAFGVVLGKETELFCRMANRAGSLLPREIDNPILENVRKTFEKPTDDGKSIVVANRNPLAKWLNLILVATHHAHPERLELGTLSVDPFAASLTAFDLFLPFSES